LDRVDSKTRSRIMAAVRSRGCASTEGALRWALVRGAIRGWRMNARDLKGKPDFVFDRQSLAVFVDGCHWHGCPTCFRQPRTNIEYWKKKINRNKARDRAVTSFLRRNGWRVLRVWEHELRMSPAKVILGIRRQLV
jgi:DNA mismatch endonuclease Vsr